MDLNEVKEKKELNTPHTRTNPDRRHGCRHVGVIIIILPIIVIIMITTIVYVINCSRKNNNDHPKKVIVTRQVVYSSKALSTVLLFLLEKTRTRTRTRTKIMTPSKIIVTSTSCILIERSFDGGTFSSLRRITTIDERLIVIIEKTDINDNQQIVYSSKALD